MDIFDASEYEEFGRNLIKKVPFVKFRGYKRMGEILFISNHQKVLVVLFIQKSVPFEVHFSIELHVVHLYQIFMMEGFLI